MRSHGRAQDFRDDQWFASELDYAEQSRTAGSYSSNIWRALKGRDYGTLPAAQQAELIRGLGEPVTVDPLADPEVRALIALIQNKA